MQTIDEALEKLQASPFRAKFRLSERERAYIGEKGLDTIREHARGFIETRLAPAELPNDGRQTPMRGHPVFLAQHACATMLLRPASRAVVSSVPVAMTTATTLLGPPRSLPVNALLM